MIEFKNIEKSFDGNKILQDVSHIMDTGKCNLIIGTSGSGKTVLQKCLVGLFEPDEGEIIYDGKNFTEMTEEERKLLRQQIGMLFQGSALFDSMNVENNIKFPLDMFTKDPLSKKLKRVNEVLERVNLTGSNKKLPSEISGGMKKRVAIARAMINDPLIIMGDEPSGNLDKLNSKIVFESFQQLIKEFNQTLLIVTHDPEFAAGTDRILEMEDGRIIKQ